MAVYINEGHRPYDGGKPFKHLSGSCPELVELDRAGYPKKRVANVDNKKPLPQHVRRRCPMCFEEPRGLDLPMPRWLKKAATLERRTPKPAF